MRKILLLILAGGILASFSDKKVTKLKPESSEAIAVNEPSDICLNPNTGGYFTVSDNGQLYELDANFKVFREAKFKGMDFEGVFADDKFVYIMDESLRKITVLDIHTLKQIRSNSITYLGGRNKGFESLTYNPIKKRFITVTEKDPMTVMELDENLVKVNEMDFKGARDISSACWHEGNLFFLSDEDHMIIEVNPEDYSVINRYYIPVPNPEGITFNKDGKVVVCSDDMHRAYLFTLPQLLR